MSAIHDEKSHVSFVARHNKRSLLEEDVKLDMNRDVDVVTSGKYYLRACEEVFARKRARLVKPLQAAPTTLNINTQLWKDFFWSKNADIEAKIYYVVNFGEITTNSSVRDIACYLLTLHDMNCEETLAEMVEKLFMSRGAEVDQVIRANLSTCLKLQADVFVDTPLHNYEHYQAFVLQLSASHFHNLRWALQFRTAKRQRQAKQTPDTFLGVLGATPPPELPPPDLDGSQRNVIEKKPEQLLLAFLFERANALGVWRTKTDVFEPVNTADGNYTRYYERKCDMTDWIFSQVNENEYPMHFNTLTLKNKPIPYLLEYLGVQPDIRFPFVLVCRTLFSFENGIFNADENKFYPYVEPLEIPAHSRLGRITDLAANVSTAQYFKGVALPLSWFMNPDFNHEECIQTPCIDKIFLDQDYSREDMRWVRAMHGRALHDMLGQHESWQVIVHTKGPAGCGKSVIAKVLKAWYPSHRFGVLNDDIEDSFPDSHLIDSFIVVCFDASPDFGLAPTRFLCWASSDDVNIKRKFKDPICKQWTAPVLFFSNYELPVQGGSGSAIRRGFIIPLEKAVKKVDGNLTQNAIAEAGLYLVKCTFDYHEKCRLHGKDSIWDNHSILPKRFWRAREEYAKASSWADAFVLDERFEYGEGFELSVDIFKKEYKQFQSAKKALPGVNRSRKYGHGETRIPPCTPSEFANALRSVRQHSCEWDETRNVILGLRLTGSRPEPITMSQAARPKRHRELELEHPPEKRHEHEHLSQPGTATVVF